MVQDPASFGFESTTEDVTEGVSLTGKTMLITGANSGLGFESARILAARGAHIVALARTRDKAQSALEELGVEGTPVACELSDLAAVRAAVKATAATGRKLDAVICNAGIMALQEPTQKNGIELQLYTNHIGHFALVTGLMDQDALADDARVVVVSSGAHHYAPDAGIEFDNISGEQGYEPWKAYGQSKIANILFARSLAKRFEGTERTANALHPGVIKTNLGRHLSDYEGVLSTMKQKTIPQGAATQVFLAAHPAGNATNGEYYSDCQVARTKSVAKDDALAKRLWTWSESVVQGENV